MDTATTGYEGVLSAQAGSSAPQQPIEVLTSHFDQLYTRIYGYMLHRLFNRELAEELTAEAFYRAAAHQRSLYADERRIEAWLLRTATRLADTHYRQSRLRRLLLGRFARDRRSATSDPAHAGNAADAGLERARQVLQGLPLRHQSVIVLRYYLEMSFDEMAAVLGCRPQAVRVRLSRAVDQMRNSLDATSNLKP